MDLAIKEKELKIVIDGVNLKPDSVSSLKMLFFASIPESLKTKLEGGCSACLRRGKDYISFDNGIKQYNEEIDIVKIIRDLTHEQFGSLFGELLKIASNLK